MHEPRPPRTHGRRFFFFWFTKCRLRLLDRHKEAHRQLIVSGLRILRSELEPEDCLWVNDGLYGSTTLTISIARANHMEPELHAPHF